MSHLISRRRFLGQVNCAAISALPVLNTILKQAFARARVTPPSPYVGSHVLRHSLATNLIRQGASLNEVGDMLRHRSRRSTMIYAQLDIEGLRGIAQPWPVAGGVK